MIVYTEQPVYGHLIDAGIDPRAALGALTYVKDQGPAISHVPDPDDGFGTWSVELFQPLYTVREINTIRALVGLLPVPDDPLALVALFGAGVTVPECLDESTTEESDQRMTIRHEIREEDHHG